MGQANPESVPDQVADAIETTAEEVTPDEAVVPDEETAAES